MIRLNRVSSLIRLISFIFVSGLVIGITLLVIISILFPTSTEFYLLYIKFVMLMLIFQYVFIELIAKLISKFNNNTIQFSENIVVYNNREFDVNQLKIFYSRLNIQNVLEFNACSLIASYKGEKIHLGWYTNREIKKLLKIIDSIIIS